MDALALLERQRVDAVISDILMPRMDGYRLCHEIRKHARLRDLPIIIYSSTYTSPEDEKLALEMGADKYLKKPASVATLVAALHEVVAQPHAAPRPDALREVEVLKNYNERLVSKLKEKNTELQAQTEALRESQAQLQLISDNVLDLVAQIRLDGTYVYVSPSYETILGYPPQRLMGTSVFAFVHPEDLERVQAAFAEVIQQSAGRVEFRYRHADGRYVWVDTLGKVFIDEAGAPSGAVLSTRDITERKQAESQREAALEELQVSEKKLNEAQALGQIGNWEYDINTQKITWSKQVYKLYERDPVLGPLTAEEEAVYYSPEQAQTLRGYTRNAIETGQFFEYDLQATLPSGKRVYLSARMRPIKDAQGHVIKLFGIVQDITESKLAEEALTKSEEKFRKVFNTSPDSVGITRLEDGMYLSINPGFTKSTGYTEEDIFGKTAIGVNIWDNIEDRQRLVAGLKKDREVTNLEAAFQIKDGNIRYGLMSTAIIDLDGVPHFLSITRDITERKQAEEKIKNSLVEKEVLLKEVHHRVKNNLMIIIGLIKMQETKADNEMFNPLMLELEGRIRAMALVHEGLYKSADLAHINLQNYIEMMSTQIHAQFGTDRDIRFSVQAAGVDVNLDSAVPCGLILNELLTNAFKHAFPAGRPGSGAGNCEINVIVNQEGGMNVLTVADNGVGLPADLDWEKSETLGLRLIKMLSKQINGSLELDRSAGTAFRLKFPMADKIH